MNILHELFQNDKVIILKASCDIFKSFKLFLKIYMS